MIVVNPKESLTSLCSRTNSVLKKIGKELVMSVEIEKLILVGSVKSETANNPGREEHKKIRGCTRCANSVPKGDRQ